MTVVGLRDCLHQIPVYRPSSEYSKTVLNPAANLYTYRLYSYHRMTDSTAHAHACVVTIECLVTKHDATPILDAGGDQKL